MRHILLLSVLLCASLLGSCRSASNGHLHLQARADDDRIAPGDTVSIVDRMRPDTVMASAKIGAEGEMIFPGLGSLKVAGQSKIELHDLLYKRYNEVYHSTELDVSVATAESRFFVYGEVNRPGRYVLEQGITALEGAMMAGPNESYANLGSVRLIRGKGETERTTELNIRRIARGDSQFNVTLENGDILYIPSTAVGKILSPITSD